MVKEKSVVAGRLSARQTTFAIIFLCMAIFVLAGGPTIFIPKKITLVFRNFLCKFQARKTVCQPSKYRNMDATCNNIEHPKWGTPNLPYERLLPAHFSGLTDHAKSVTGSDLPNPSVLSFGLFGLENHPDPELTIVMMQFGQIMAHDNSFTTLNQVETCCTDSGDFKPNVTGCSDIPVPPMQGGYGSPKVSCIKFAQTITDHDLLCNGDIKTPAQPISAVTSYYDLSLIYGNGDEQALKLRSLSGGRLKIEDINGYQWPPHDPEAKANCFTDSNSDPCFISGDTRMNQSPQLTVIHVMFLREHNRVAGELAKVNPHWNDERLYQEARRICIAKYQYIIYYEWLPIVLGAENMKQSGLIHYSDGDRYVNDYNPSVKPMILNEHAHGASRYFHTQIEGILKFYTESRDVTASIFMSDHFDNPKVTLEHFDELGRGMMTQNAQKADIHHDEQTRLFLNKHKAKFGGDLMSIDIIRGRDHGVETYNNYREFCGFKKAKKWEDYSDFIPMEHINRMKELYADFRDVDLQVGASLETIQDKTALAPPTFLCILNKQFYNLRIGDRYWFETGDPEMAFTRPQLAEIRKSTFSKIFCDNMNHVTHAQPYAFRTVNSSSNPLVHCSDIPGLNFNLWAENKLY